VTPGEKATADEYMMDVVDWFEGASLRLAGVGLECRRFKPAEWPEKWRAQMFASKNERSEYRITVYGDSMYDAIAKLRAAVEEADRR
jgi:hypothetical protein